MANYNFTEKAVDKNSEVTLTQRVYDTLRDEIMSGELAPGYRLVRRKESERLGVSRMAVTEALLKLEIDGFVESKPLFGSRVRPLTLEDVKNDEELREALETHSARLVAVHASEEELQKLLKKARELDRIASQGDRYSKMGMDLHFEFHLDFANSAGYGRYAEELKRIWYRRLMRINWIKMTKCKKVPENWHQRVIQACMERDPQKAQEQMREHVRYGQENNIQALKMILAKEDK